MATWKKVIVSESHAGFLTVTASQGFSGDGSGLTSLGTLGNALTVDNSTIQVNSGTTYDGGAARTISVKAGGIVEASLANDAVTAAKLASNAVVNASIASNAAIAHSKLAALASTKVLVGNGSNVATEVPLSGDVTMANTGAVTIGAEKVVNSMIGDGAVDTEEIADDAITAAKLASNAVVNASIAANAAIAHSKLAALASTKVLVGNGSNVATEVPLSGDVTMANTGAVTLANDAVVTAKITDANVTLAKIANAAANTVIVRDANSSGVLSAKAVATTEILIGDGTGFTAASLSGDVTMDNAGAVTIGSGVVETGMVANDAVTAAKLASNAVVDDSIAANAAIAHSKLAALASTKVLVGNGSNVAVEVPLSGDVTMANTGAVTIGAAKVVNTMIGDGAVDTEEMADDAVTAAKLASNAVVDASIAANAAIAHTKLAALAATKVLVGNGSNVATEVPLSGDVTMDNAGAVTIGEGKVATANLRDANVTTAKLAEDAVTADILASNAVVNASIAANAAIAHTKLAALAATKVLVGNGSNVATAVPLSGDVTMNNAGAVTIGSGVVETAMVANNAITGDQLADSIVIAADLTVTGDLLVSGDLTTVNTANLNVEDQFILINSGSSTATNESGIIFGGSNGAVGAGAALIWNGDYNSNDGRLAVANAVNWNATSATVNYSIAGVFEGSIADAATAQADHAGNIRIESDELFMYF